MTPDTNESNGSRRKDPRVRTIHLLSVTTDKLRGESSISIGRTLDVSASGIRVEVQGRVCIEDQLQLEIAVEDRIIQARGRVVHATRKGEDLVETGIEFTSIEDADRDVLAPD
jgi:c-di-GMP-binding flagellar brake protein YcgR